MEGGVARATGKAAVHSVRQHSFSEHLPCAAYQARGPAGKGASLICPHRACSGADKWGFWPKLGEYYKKRGSGCWEAGERGACRRGANLLCPDQGKPYIRRMIRCNMITNIRSEGVGWGGKREKKNLFTLTTKHPYLLKAKQIALLVGLSNGGTAMENSVEAPKPPPSLPPASLPALQHLTTPKPGGKWKESDSLGFHQSWFIPGLSRTAQSPRPSTELSW